MQGMTATTNRALGFEKTTSSLEVLVLFLSSNL